MFPTSAGTAIAPCPICAGDVKVEVLLDDVKVENGELVIKVSPGEVEHECLPK